MAQMRVAGITDSFNPLQEARAVKAIGDRVYLEWLRERRPSGVRFEFFIRVKEQGIATEARVNAWLEQAAHLRAERPLGARLPGDVVLFIGQLLAPLRFRLGDLAIRSRIAVLRQVEDIRPGEHVLTYAISGPFLRLHHDGCIFRSRCPVHRSGAANGEALAKFPTE